MSLHRNGRARDPDIFESVVIFHYIHTARYRYRACGSDEKAATGQSSNLLANGRRRGPVFHFKSSAQGSVSVSVSGWDKISFVSCTKIIKNTKITNKNSLLWSFPKEKTQGWFVCFWISDEGRIIIVELRPSSEVAVVRQSRGRRGRGLHRTTGTRLVHGELPAKTHAYARQLKVCDSIGRNLVVTGLTSEALESVGRTPPNPPPNPYRP